MDTSLPLVQSNRAPKSTGDAYLKFSLTPETPALLPMAAAQEVLVLPVHRLTPMPVMPAGVLGLTNHRSRVLWLVDLAHLLGLPALPINLQQYTVAIIRVDESPLALAISDVQGVIRFHPETIQAVQGSTDSALTPYLKGIVLQEDAVLLVLNPEAIVRAPSLHQRF